MRYRLILFSLSLMGLLLSACGDGETSLITPAPDRLTFLFFYTDG